MKRPYLSLLLLVAFCIADVAVAGDEARVAVFLAPKWAMGSEFMDLLDEFSELGVDVDVVSAKAGSYTFWEDSAEGFMSGAIQNYYDWTIALTYDQFSLDGYDAIVIGPGHAHTVWIGETGAMARGFIAQALEQGLPVGGVSFGAAVLVSWGFLDERSAAMPPYYQGVVTQGTNKAMFFSEYPTVTYEDAFVWVDRASGQAPIVTATYGAVRRLARELANLI